MSNEWSTLATVLFSGAGAIVLSAIVRHMPSPEAVGKNIWYTWLYNVIQTLLANPDKGGLFKNGVFNPSNTSTPGSNNVNS